MEQSLTRIRDYPKLDNGMVRLLALLGASLYLGHELNIAFFVRVFSYFGITNELAVSITSFIPLILSLPLLFRKAYRVKPFIIVYGILAFLFFIGILTHLEYLDIYFRPRFGIHKVFFPSGGIFMTYYLVLFYDEEDSSDQRSVGIWKMFPYCGNLNDRGHGSTALSSPDGDTERTDGLSQLFL